MYRCDFTTYIYRLLIAHVFWPKTANILDHTKPNGDQTVSFSVYIHNLLYIHVLCASTRARNPGPRIPPYLTRRIFRRYFRLVTRLVLKVL